MSLRILTLVCLVGSFYGSGGEETYCLRSAKLDLQIIVDSSRSVTEPNFQSLMKALAENVVEKFDIGSEKTRVALFKYSTGNVMRNEFGLNDHLTKESLKVAILSTKFEEGATFTAKAMTEALTLYEKAARRDGETFKACLVFTDGDASDKANVAAASDAWLKAGVKVVAIGIGNGINHAGLAEIAGSEDRVIRLNSYDEVGAMTQTLFSKVCAELKTQTEGSCGFRCESGIVELSGLDFFKITPHRITFKKAFKEVPAFTWGITKAVDDATMKPTWANVWLKDGVDVDGAGMGALIFDSRAKRNKLNFNWMACGN